MKLCLILAIFLLGAISAYQHDEASVEQEVSAEQNEVKPGDPEPPCPMDGESFRMTVLGLRSRTCRYVVVNRCQNFWRARRYCARCYRGQLASIHNYSNNERLRRAACSRTNRGLVWIGAITVKRRWRVCAYWVDRSRWNYSNWAGGNPSRSRSCVAMCTSRGGKWRSVNCRVRLPFVCQY